MNEIVKRNWTELDGCLVFDFTINRNPGDGIPTIVTIRCSTNAAGEQTVVINEKRPTPFDVKFRSGCYVRGVFEMCRGVHVDGVPCTGIAADIDFGIGGVYSNKHFEGLMVVWPTVPTPPHPDPGPGPWPPRPIPPEEPTEPGSPVPVVTGSAGELFSYVYVRRWPRVSSEDLRFAFIAYAAGSPPTDAFLNDLATACARGRGAAEALALAFIDGNPPYQAQYVTAMRDLDGPLRDFPALAMRSRREAAPSKPWLEALALQLDALLARYGQDVSYFSSSSYGEAVDRIWQSYFALVVTLGYEPQLLDEFALSLWLAHVVARAVVPAGDGPIILNTLTPQQIALLAEASVILPPEAFPLPPATAPSPPGAANDPMAGTILPYAIGDLQLVRQRLVRYAAGEIARIENVMRGERKEISDRQLQRHVEYRENRGNDQQILESEGADERSSLIEETRRTVAEKSIGKQYDNFTANYGPPTQATLGGSWTSTITGGTPGFDDVTRFARDVVAKAVNRLTRNIGTLRATSAMNQQEHTVSSVIDNIAGPANLRGIYRWLNKIYEAWVVHYGNRLVMEFIIRRPAATFILEQAVLSGERMVKPIPPLRQGLYSFEQITPDNYARLCAEYGVTDIQPPPLAQKIGTATLRGGGETQIAIPEGYCASTAFVTCITAPPPTTPPAIMVGRQVVPSGGGAVPLQVYGENATIPVSVGDVAPTLSPPCAPEVLVNVEIQCIPTARTMDEWRIAIYRVVMTAYHQQCERYYAQTGGDEAAPRSSLANRQIERSELKSGCIRLLVERAALLTGAAASGSPPAADIAEPRLAQFLDDALEWDEMAYSFQAGLRRGGYSDPAQFGAGADDVFTSFLQAEQARVLLPVRPNRLLAFLYFFSSGAVWDSPDGLIAALKEDVALIDDVKHCAPEHGRERKIGAPWEIVVPTTLQILDEASTNGFRGVDPALKGPE